VRERDRGERKKGKAEVERVGEREESMIVLEEDEGHMTHLSILF
jgi:hypothetical protein